MQGHERALTKIQYNREGDLLFSADKGSTPSVWYSVNGERLGTYNGHNGTVWTIDVNWDSTSFVSASADSSVRVWDVQTGKDKNLYTLETPCRCCAFSYDGNMILYTNDNVMGKDCEIYLADIRTRRMCIERMNFPFFVKISKNFPFLAVEGPLARINISQSGHSRVTSALWGTLDQFIITGHDNGELVQWDIKVKKKNVYFTF